MRGVEFVTSLSISGEVLVRNRCVLAAVIVFGVACGSDETGAYYGDPDGGGGSATGGTGSGGAATGGMPSGGAVAGGDASGGAAEGGAAAGGMAAGGDASGGAGGTGGVTPAGARIGGECAVSEDCTSGFCLDSAFAQSVAMDPTVEVPGGYCTDLSCQVTPDCDQDDASCIDLRASGLDIPFKACFQTCDPEAAPSPCRTDHSCYCDPEGDITDVEMNRGLCLCLPEVLISLLSEG